MRSKRGRWVRDLGGAVAVAAVVFVMAEIGVRLVGWEPREWPAPGTMGFFREVAMDPLLGPLPRPGWSGKWFGQFETRIDDRGFRSTGLPAIDAPRRRVVFLGDSCTFGWGIDTPETFVAQLDAMQRARAGGDTELVDLAYPGQSAVVGEYMLRERALPLHPDLVVLAYSANNAFRFSVVADRRRFRFFELRKLLLRSRLFHVLGAWLANRAPAPPEPRDRAEIAKIPFADVKRVADPGEFEAAVRAMVGDARSHGAEVAFLVLPRASGVTTEFAYEDAGLARRPDPNAKPALPGRVTAGDMALLEVSCLDHRRLGDPAGALRDAIAGWRAVYPSRPDVRAQLRAGARAYRDGAYQDALAAFGEAVRLQPDSPLALYDLGATQLALGNAADGLRLQADADRLACNVFLQYQVILWRVGTELHVSVVDAALHLQAEDEGPLFLDGAHPNARGHRVVADALWPLLAERERRPATSASCR